IPAEASAASSCSRLNCGKRKLAGRLRTSQSVSTQCCARTERKGSISRFEWPMVKRGFIGTSGCSWRLDSGQVYSAGRPKRRQAHWPELLLHFAGEGGREPQK